MSFLVLHCIKWHQYKVGSAIRSHYGRMDRYLDNQKNYRTLVNTPLATARLNSVESGGRVYRVRECPRIPLLQNKPRDHPSGCDAFYLLRRPGLFQALHRLGVGLGWLYVAAGTPHLHTHQFQAEPCRRSYCVAPTIERINLGCASNLM